MSWVDNNTFGKRSVYGWMISGNKEASPKPRRPKFPRDEYNYGWLKKRSG